MTNKTEFKEGVIDHAGRLSTFAANQRNMGGGYSEVADSIDAVLLFISETVRERDSAWLIADPYVCDFIRNESGEEGGWRRIDEDPEGMHAVFHYAERRSLVENDPERPGWFRFTKKGRAWL